MSTFSFYGESNNISGFLIAISSVSFISFYSKLFLTLSLFLSFNGLLSLMDLSFKIAEVSSITI